MRFYDWKLTIRRLDSIVKINITRGLEGLKFYVNKKQGKLPAMATERCSCASAYPRTGHHGD